MAFEPVEIPPPRFAGVPGGGARAQPQRLVWLAALLPHLREIGGSDLEDEDLIPPTVAIQGDGIHQRWQQPRTQGVHVVAQGIRHAHGIGGDPQRLELATRDQGRVPCLVEAGTGEHVAGRVSAAVDARYKRSPGVVAPARQRRRDAIVAPDATHLFDEVLRNRDVEPEDWRENVPLAVAQDFDVETQPGEDGFSILYGQVESAQL